MHVWVGKKETERETEKEAETEKETEAEKEKEKEGGTRANLDRLGSETPLNVQEKGLLYIIFYLKIHEDGFVPSVEDQESTS